MPNRVTGTSAGERLVGRNTSSDFDFIRGLGGNDTLVGLLGSDRLDGGDGNDRFEYLTTTQDIDIGESVIGGSGIDTIVLTGNKNLNNLFDLESIEALEFRGSASSINKASLASSQISAEGFSTTARIIGSAGQDTFYLKIDQGNTANLSRFAFANWSDGDVIRITGSTGADSIGGTVFADVISGAGGNDTMFGGLGNDTYYVNSQLDQIREGQTGGDNDLVYASASIRTLWGYVESATLTGSSANYINGNELDNVLTGNRAANFLDGKAGDDRLVGGAGSDRLVGGAGKDMLFGGTGNEIMTGGSGRDAFFLTDRLSATSNLDRITDFETGQDTLYLNSALLRGISTTGPLSSSMFKATSSLSGLDTSDRIIFDPMTNVLSYDSDGSGSAAAIRFAIIDNDRIIKASDFFVL